MECECQEEQVPTYQYQCTECGEGLEAVQKFSDDALTECPSCDGRLRKVFSAVGVVFKGSGFYRTDSRSSSSGSAPAAAKGEASSPSSTSSKDSPGSKGSSDSKGSSGSKASQPSKPAAPAPSAGTSAA